jgi:glycogen debranching enzyme
VKDNLLLQKRFQIKEGNNKGKIYHELSLAHSFVPDPSYSYVAGDSTPLYVILCSEYAKWSGDKEFLGENWESIKDALDWCERMDVDGDLLIDNPPAGHQWFDYGEKNMIDLVAIWQKALEEGVYIARLLGKEDLARKWEDKARKVNRILNEDFWNAKRNFFYDRKLPDDSFLDLATCNPLIPLLWREIEENKAEIALSYFASPPFTTDWGVRTTSKDERIYNPWGYHEGTVWPLVTGWASWAQFVNCHPIEGYANLLRNAKMTRDFCLGYIPEILNGDRYEAGGCPLQGWSEAMVILPLLRGMLGLEPNALEKRMRMTIHIPEEIAFLKLTNITVGDSKWEIEWKNEGRRASLKIKKERGSDYFIELAISVKAFQQAEAISDGKRIALEKINKPCGYHILSRSSVDKELSVNFSKQ